MKLADMGLRSAHHPCCQKFAGISLNQTRFKISGPVGDRPEEDHVGMSQRSRDVCVYKQHLCKNTYHIAGRFLV